MQMGTSQGVGARLITWAAALADPEATTATLQQR